MSQPGGELGGAGGTAALIVAGGGFLGVIGKGVAWVWRQRKGRITQLEAALEQLRGEFQEMAQACADERLENVRRVDCLVTVCIVLIEDVEAGNPGSRAIPRARALLGAEFPDLLRRTFPAEDQANLPDELLDLALRGSAALRRTAGESHVEIRNQRARAKPRR
jgi:hypothetical protein